MLRTFLAKLLSILVSGPLATAPRNGENGKVAPAWWPILIAAASAASMAYFGQPLCP
jgi:hypothetical protein